MRINLKRLTDAVPELMELEFIAEDNAILISTTISIAQAEDLFDCLRKALTAHCKEVADLSAATATKGHVGGLLQECDGILAEKSQD